MRLRGNVAFELEVIPGITAIQALAASHKMALNPGHAGCRLQPAQRTTLLFSTYEEVPTGMAPPPAFRPMWLSWSLSTWPPLARVKIPTNFMSPFAPRIGWAV